MLQTCYSPNDYQPGACTDTMTQICADNETDLGPLDSASTQRARTNGATCHLSLPDCLPPYRCTGPEEAIVYFDFHGDTGFCTAP